MFSHQLGLPPKQREVSAALARLRAVVARVCDRGRALSERTADTVRKGAPWKHNERQRQVEKGHAAAHAQTMMVLLYNPEDRKAKALS